MDALNLLKNQHEEIAAFFEKIESSKDHSEQADLMAQLADSFLTHSHIEEHIFYPAAFEEKTEDELREAVEEHLQAKRMIADILEMDPSDEQWTAKCTVLKEEIQHHVKEEEETLFPMVRESMSKSRLSELGTQMSERAEELRQEGSPRDLVWNETNEAVLPV